MNKKHMKPAALVVALVLTVAMILTGTFAWRSISQQAWNQAIGSPGPAGGRLHDHFEIMGANFGEQRWQAGVTANKDVFVENFERAASSGRDIFVRIRLYEYMEIGGGANLHPGDSGFAGREAQSIIAGAVRTDFATWNRRLPGDTPASNPMTYFWDWGMGGWKYFIPTFNRDPYSLESDTTGDAIDPQALQAGETRNSTHRGQSHAFPLEAGRENFWGAGDSHEALVKYWCEDIGHRISTYTTRHDARRTLTATHMTMEAWEAAGSVPGPFWVWDADGWFYWAQPLRAEQATGLLLSNITLRTDPEAQWYYAIFVDAEMATAGEWEDAWFHAPGNLPSASAQALMSAITGRPVTTPNNQPFGAWLWGGPSANRVPHAQMMQYLDFAAAQGVNEIYFSAGLTRPHWNETQVKEFISTATSHGIAVYYLTGDYSWVSHHDRLISRLEAFEAYQAAACDATRFAGVHLNIEPHQDARWRTGDPQQRGALLQSYIDLKVTVTDMFGPMDWSIPFWWRAEPAYHMVEYRGETMPLYRASILSADRVFVMSYRNTAQATYDIAQHYVAFARQVGRPLFLSALVNPGGEDEALGHVFFRDLGHARMMDEFAQLRELVDLPRLGIAVHEIGGWHQMWARDFA